MKYFSDYKEEAPEASIEERPVDHGDDVLPFGQLGGRRFEILVYRLLLNSVPEGYKVSLMQGVGEKGRDLLVYDKQKHISKVVQCKNLENRITKSACVNAILKIALHTFLEPQIVGSGRFTFELWCPGDFSEPAAELIDTWPSGWIESDVEETFTAMKQKYVSFSKLTWSQVRKTVMQRFPKRLDVTRVSGIDATIRVRELRDVYETFFAGIVVMKREDVKSELKDVLSQGGLRIVQDEELRHLLDRLESFNDDERQYFGHGHVFGIRYGLYKYFDDEQLKEFYLNLNAISRIGGLLLKVTQNLVNSLATDMFETISKPGNFRYVLRQTLFIRSMTLLTKWMFMLPDRPYKFAETMTDRELFIQQAGEAWEEMTGIVDRLKDAVLAPGSDDDLRLRTAKHALAEFPNERTLVQSLTAEFDENIGTIGVAFNRLRELLPSQMMVLLDSTTIFQEKSLMASFTETIRKMEEVRGKEAVNIFTNPGPEGR